MKDKHFITSDGCQLTYQHIQHSPHSPTLVFLHGLGGDLSVWQPLARYVFRKYSVNCILIDLRGHGLSSKTIPSTSGNLFLYVDDIIALLHHKHVTHPILIGHCFGGNVALATLDKLVSKAIVTINTAPLTPHKSFRERIKPYLLYRMIYYVRFLFTTAPKADRSQIDRSIHHQDFNPIRIRDDIRRTGIKSYLFALNSFATFNPNPYIFTATTPIIAVLGKYDRLFPYKRAMREYSIYKNASVTIANDNHLIPLNWSAEKLALFLSELLAARGIHDLKT